MIPHSGNPPRCALCRTGKASADAAIFMKEVPDMRILVVYYSRTQKTKKVAQAIAEAVGADLSEITEETPRDGVLGFIGGGYDALFNRLARIRELDRRVEDYDLVVLGTPVWAGRPATPATTFLKKYCNGIKKLAVFILHGSPNDDYPGVIRFLEQAAGKKAASTLSLAASAAETPGAMPVIQFANGLNRL